MRPNTTLQPPSLALWISQCAIACSSGLRPNVEPLGRPWRLREMLTERDFEPIIAAVPSFQRKWVQWKEQGELCEPVSVEFSFRIVQHLIERATVDDFTDFMLLSEALEAPYRIRPLNFMIR
jgi:hypothetical protein